MINCNEWLQQTNLTRNVGCVKGYICFLLESLTSVNICVFFLKKAEVAFCANLSFFEIDKCFYILYVKQINGPDFFFR
jgi:hypothetical protein